MLLGDNFAHADLHAGNVIITLQKTIPSSFLQKECISEMSVEEIEALKSCKSTEEWCKHLESFKLNGYKPKLVLVDAGLVSVLSPVSLGNFTDVVQAALQFNGVEIADLLIKRSTHPTLVIDEVLAKEKCHL